MKRKQGGRGLISVRDCVKEEELVLLDLSRRVTHGR